MAKGQSQGGGAVTIGMFVFVALWLASTVVLIILYTNQEDLKQLAETLKQDNQRLVSRSERSSIAQFQSAQPGGPTLAGLLEGARAETARLATGSETDDVGSVQTKLDQIRQTVKADGIVPNADQMESLSYHESLEMLYDAFKTENALRTAAEARVAELGGEVDRLVQVSAQLQSDFEQQSQQQSATFAEAEAERARFRDQKDTQLANLERDLDARRKEHDADLTQERQQNAALQSQVERLESRLVALQERVGDKLIGPKALLTARIPDGSIIQHIPGDDFVFINLGRRSKLVLGMRFAVYSASKEIPVDGRAKAQIEVVSIDQDSSECKILRQSSYEVVVPGDVIANPIYDADREVRFLVMGEFDLDHDGSIDPDGTERINALVTDWGGTLSSEITALLDFVVLGREPRRPRPPRDQTPDSIAKYEQMKKTYDAYAQTLHSAATLQVPILRQEVFLNFLGYSNRPTY